MPIPEAIREIFKQGRPDNPSSWRWTVAFFEYVTAGPYGARCLPLLRLVQHLADSPYAENFRAGQSLHSLLISTKLENGLEATDPYIFVNAEPNSALLRLEYWPCEERDGLEESHSCSEAELLIRLKPLLARLWNETKGQDQIAS